MAMTIQRWSGREIRALREARRMTLHAFAGHLGVSERMVSKWEGENVVPRPVNQLALDTSLTSCSPEEQTRFAHALGLASHDPGGSRERPGSVDEPPILAGDEHLIRHPVDGKLMALVEAGMFFSGPDDEPIHLPAFYIDVFPITNADYDRFVTATQGKPPPHWNHAVPPDGLLNHPVVFVTWYEANAYAQWSAKALPTSRQWEKAARGTRGEIYPWGSQRTPAKCNCREHEIRSTTPVDRYASGVSPYGVYDLCGNTWEWCSAESEPGRYELKGSAFTSSFLRCPPAMFNDASADMSDDDTGFRCVTPADTLIALLHIAR